MLAYMYLRAMLYEHHSIDKNMTLYSTSLHARFLKRAKSIKKIKK
jgi:hypothetical protein